MTQTTNKNRGNGKKYLVYAIMVIIFLACMWLIFSPSAADREAEKQGVGFNADIPDPRGAGIVGDKKTAYEQERQRLRESERMNTLDDYSRMTERQGETEEERAAREQRQLRMAPKPVEYYDDPERFGEGGSVRYGGGTRSSSTAHAELTGTLGTFFEEPGADPEKEEMAAEIERLNALVAEREAERTDMDEQLALMERSYQLAAKYSGGGAAQYTDTPASAAYEAPAAPAPSAPGRKAAVEVVSRENRSVVSSLAAPLSDAEFARRFSQERNRGFHTVGGREDGEAKNTIAAVVHGEQSVADGQTVRLRTAEAMLAGGILIPRNTIITGTGGISGERLQIEITAIEYGGNVIPVELAVHDSDGQEGVYVPGSMESEAFKEIAGNMGSGLGSTINLNRQGAGEQLLTDLGRGVIQGTSQYVSKKAREVKVTLKAGYRLLLLPETNP
jgi:conjugative transposon TraM protein